jgi:tight adherence protein C
MRRTGRAVTRSGGSAMSPLLLLSGVVVCGALAMVMIGLGRRPKTVNIDDRLAHFAERDEVKSLRDREMELSFGQRVLKPLIRSWALKLGAMTPAANNEKLRKKIAEAGNPSGIGPVEFVGMRLLLALGLGVGSFFLFGLAGSGVMRLLVPLSLTVFGFLMPKIWLDRKAKARRKDLIRSLPDAIDLLAISVESGLGFDQAMLRVAEKWDNTISREFGRLLSEMRIGKSKREGLREMADRCGVDDLNTFVSAVIQADQLGVAITQVLRVQSEALRVRRRQRAEELAQKAPIKMLFPMIFLIFPALYVVILGPAVPRLMETLGGQ